MSSIAPSDSATVITKRAKRSRAYEHSELASVQTNFEAAMVDMVIMEDLPFAFVESPWFRKVVASLKPNQNVIGRTSLKSRW